MGYAFCESVRKSSQTLERSPLALEFGPTYREMHTVYVCKLEIDVDGVYICINKKTTLLVYYYYSILPFH